MDSFPHVSCVQCSQRFITKQDYTCYHCTHTNLKEELTELCQHFTADPVTQDMTSEDEKEDTADEDFIDDRSTEELTQSEEEEEDDEDEDDFDPHPPARPVKLPTVNKPADGTIHGRLWH